MVKSLVVVVDCAGFCVILTSVVFFLAITQIHFVWLRLWFFVNFGLYIYLLVVEEE